MAFARKSRKDLIEEMPTDRLKGSTELNQMFNALSRTSDWLRRDFGEVENLQQSLKGATGFVQKAATRIEENILSDLTLIRPYAGVLTPNVSVDGDGRDEFVLSVSGAANFVRANPNFAISLALRSNDETRIAMIYFPIEDRLYYSEKGNGTFQYSAFHSTRVKVSEHKADPKDLTIGFGSVGAANSFLTPHSSFLIADTRITGCPACDMAWVASGKFDAFISSALDFAEICAAEMLVNEAGGKVWEQNGDLFVTNGQKIFEA